MAGCQACHAPGTEQLPTRPGRVDEAGRNPDYVPALRGEGLACFACHVRAHLRYGPPPGDRPTAQVCAGPGHGGAVITGAFESPAFCATCHQFGPASARVNATLLQNTNEEWNRSPQAAEGATCQTCHMPDRRHLWRGIHDPETVRDAVKVDVTDVQESGGSVSAEVRVANIGAGHHLPTYVTPMIFVQAELLDGQGRPVPGSRSTRAIGREVDLRNDPWKEVFDTRIPAGGAWSWRYAATAPGSAAFIRIRLEVHPDHHYLRFFSVHDRTGLSDRAAAMFDVAEERAPVRLPAHRRILAAFPINPLAWI